jgi:hypothetical protein
LGNTKLKSMVKGEEVMPVPGGEITTTEIWSNPDAVSNQVVEEAQEDITAGEADATEQEVVEGGSETEG